MCYNSPMMKKVSGLCVTLLFLGLILYKIDFENVLSVLKLFHVSYLPYIVIFYILSLFLRGVRWKLFLNNDVKYSWLNLAEISTVGTMLNIFIPARAGDLFRAYYLGQVKNEKKLKIFGSVILERLFDGTAIFLILLFSVKLYFSTSEVINFTATIAGVLFLGSLALAFAIFRFNKLNSIFDFIEKKLLKSDAEGVHWTSKLRYHANSFSEGFSVLKDNKVLSLSLVYSLLIWGLECVVVFFIINSFELSFPPSAAFFVLTLTTFSTMLPSTSIFLGPFQAAYILALSIYGADKELALAISVVHNLILMVIISAIGLTWMLRHNFVGRKIQQTVDTKSGD